ncbi:MAG: tRNA uridine-5-carboxymethylaminomethyl(34) synthesis GTPase MnmE [Candidatus Shikimatogenerans bostrichidophilus]|nr:MAG: tRNA uridine-5-carboxymethylaminomethyl(34) synthesis GTPase MnmE [Candidatus Shikimatogenerans bostrichidophilus]
MNNYIIYKNDNDTITAISSPLGIGAISIIRISGDKSIKIIKKIFVNKTKKIYKEKINLGIIKYNKEIIDKVIIIYFKNPNSYTGEDLVEIYCHGSIYIQNKIIKIIIKNGGRLAKKGEFTYRAYFNKKITLLEAESVLDTIKCENKIEHKIAINNLIKNRLYKVLLKIQKIILNILSYIEVKLDFIEENINISSKKIYNKILYVEKKLKKLINSFKISYIIKKGLYISIIGPVNSGKSTLMNTLINEDKSIISNIPGTTRDIVEGNILINNFKFYLFDTAGIRKSRSNIEKIGIKKTFKNIDKSNIIFYVFDYNLLKKNIKKFKKKIINKFFKKDFLLIANKIDLNNNLKKKKLKIRKIKIKKNIYNIIFISAKKKIGIKNIIDYLKRKIPNKRIQNNILINNIRHYEELRQTLKYIKKIKKDYLKQKSLEFISIDLRRSLKFLYNIHGQNFDNNDVLKNIFTKFCIGK